MAKEKLPKELEKSQLNEGKSLIGEETASKQKDLKSALSEKGPNHFEKINLLSGIDESKLAELQKADVVCVYRDNDTYREMASKLEQLVKDKNGGKIYCIIIPQGTEVEQLTEQDKKTLTEVLTTCKCITDFTVSTWTRTETKKIEDVVQDNEKTEYRHNVFLNEARNIEKYCIEKGIDTVYILSSYQMCRLGLIRCEEGAPKKFERGPVYEKVIKVLLEHGGFCQKVDGTIYFDSVFNDDDEEHYEDAKRFWKNLFPNINVEFIEGENLLRWTDRSGEPNEYEFKYKKAEGSLAIADRHQDKVLKNYLDDGGNRILFAGGNFEGNGGIKNFSAGTANYGEFLAEKITKLK